MRTPGTGDIGPRAVTAAAREFGAWGWAFYEPRSPDAVFDALAEESDDGFLTGRMVRLILKAGRAFFANPDAEGWLYRGRNAELSYWLSCSLPVVLLAHHPDTRADLLAPRHPRRRHGHARRLENPHSIRDTCSARMPAKRSRP